MAVFDGESWKEARKTLFTKPLADLRRMPPAGKGKDVVPDEVSLLRLHGNGKIEVKRSCGAPTTWIHLGHTTPQELVAEFGPPDAIYRKSDQRMLIHKARIGSNTYRTRPSFDSDRPDFDSTDTEQSSAYTGTDHSEDESDDSTSPHKSSAECFYNYYYHGFDVLISNKAQISPVPPSQRQNGSADEFENSDRETPSPPPGRRITSTSSPFLATKIIIHGNVPATYAFNRHRRCRWEIAYLPTSPNSETPFPLTSKQLHEEWESIYATAEGADARLRGMVLNRGWGESPGSSCEMLPGLWEGEDSEVLQVPVTPLATAVQGAGVLGSTTLFGFPGLVFEVAKSGCVCCVTVF
jgi:hypothetical protein